MPDGIFSQASHVLRQSQGLRGDMHRSPQRQGGAVPCTVVDLESLGKDGGREGGMTCRNQ